MQDEDAAHAVVDASRAVIDEALLVFKQQTAKCGWNHLDIYPLTKTLIEHHFLLGIFDTLTAHWETPTQPPDRALIVFMLYLAEFKKMKRTKSVIRIIRDLRHQQSKGQGFVQSVFLCGQHAPTNPDALSFIAEQSVQAGYGAKRAISKAKKRSLIVVASALGAAVTSICLAIAFNFPATHVVGVGLASTFCIALFAGKIVGIERNLVGVQSY